MDTGAPSGEKKMAQVNECVTDCGNLKCRYNAANIKEKNVFLVFMRDKKGCEGYKRLKKAGDPEKDGKTTPKNVRKTRAAAGGAKEKKSRAAAGRAKTKRTGSTAKRTQEAGRTTARKERGK